MKVRRYRMSSGMHLDIEAARTLGKLDQCSREHPTKAHPKAFDTLLDAMANVKPPKRGGEGRET